LARHRSPSGAQEYDPERTVRLRAVHSTGAHRLPAPPTASVCGRATVAAVAAGAVVAAGQTLISPFVPAEASPQEVSALLPVAQASTAAPTTDPAVRAIGGDQLSPNALSFARALDPASAVDVQSLAKATDIGDRLAKNAALIEGAESSGAQDAHVVGNEVFVMPAQGTFTSGFGARWGVVHYGIDLANAIGTPIYAYTDGVVEDAGPASGFGLWVVLRHPDGTHSVYGHVNRMFVKVGQQVRAGQKIAEIGNRGESTGPHLHFEVWAPDGTKINPLPWLASHGINAVGGATALQ
jgi:murein DD-endopeptidase MepM/ murein hydrolase activator NlpD